SGTLFDYASVHIITTATLRRLKEAYPEGQITLQRFRPNIVVDCANETGFVENSWAGRTLTLGSELVLRVSIPCPRCVMTTLPQADLGHDPRILRALVDHNRLDLGDFGHLPCAGIYADVVQPGSIRRGDRVELGD
ncbi:MAG TPA: MOSC domain-containing protein, partial [Candidatus Binatia bacterium]|nr:MOSC domain-containing protein [Candidatus Binatia bacterium]